MALPENDTALIEKHFEGLLTKEEEIMLNEKKQLTPGFAEEMELQKTMITAIRLEENRLLKEELKKEAQKIVLPTANQKKVKWYGIAATLLVLVVSIFVLLPSKNSLFNAYYVPFPGSPVTRSENNDKGNYTLAMQQYSMGNYEQALVAFLMINSPENQDEISLYIGNSYLSLGQTSKAIDYLQITVNSTNEQIKVQGQWYIALAYINYGNKQQAKKQLKTIVNSENSYSKQAVVLLKKLDWAFY